MSEASSELARRKAREVTSFARLALRSSPTDRAQEAAAELRQSMDWLPLDEADAVVVLGGDGFMLDTLHTILDSGRISGSRRG